jgi:hypothetical protein
MAVCDRMAVHDSMAVRDSVTVCTHRLVDTPPHCHCHRAGHCHCHLAAGGGGTGHGDCGSVVVNDRQVRKASAAGGVAVVGGWQLW